MTSKSAQHWGEGRGISLWIARCAPLDSYVRFAFRISPSSRPLSSRRWIDPDGRAITPTKLSGSRLCGRGGGVRQAGWHQSKVMAKASPPKVSANHAVTPALSAHLLSFECSIRAVPNSAQFGSNIVMTEFGAPVAANHFGFGSIDRALWILLAGYGSKPPTNLASYPLFARWQAPPATVHSFTAPVHRAPGQYVASARKLLLVRGLFRGVGGSMVTGHVTATPFIPGHSDRFIVPVACRFVRVASSGGTPCLHAPSAASRGRSFYKT